MEGLASRVMTHTPAMVALVISSSNPMHVRMDTGSSQYDDYTASQFSAQRPTSSQPYAAQQYSTAQPAQQYVAQGQQTYAAEKPQALYTQSSTAQPLYDQYAQGGYTGSSQTRSEAAYTPTSYQPTSSSAYQPTSTSAYQQTPGGYTSQVRYPSAASGDAAAYQAAKGPSSYLQATGTNLQDVSRAAAIQQVGTEYHPATASYRGASAQTPAMDPHGYSAYGARSSDRMDSAPPSARMAQASLQPDVGRTSATAAPGLYSYAPSTGGRPERTPERHTVPTSMPVGAQQQQAYQQQAYARQPTQPMQQQHRDGPGRGAHVGASHGASAHGRSAGPRPDYGRHESTYGRAQGYGPSDSYGRGGGRSEAPYARGGFSSGRGGFGGPDRGRGGYHGGRVSGPSGGYDQASRSHERAMPTDRYGGRDLSKPKDREQDRTKDNERDRTRSDGHGHERDKDRDRDHGRYREKSSDRDRPRTELRDRSHRSPSRDTYSRRSPSREANPRSPSPRKTESSRQETERRRSPPLPDYDVKPPTHSFVTEERDVLELSQRYRELYVVPDFSKVVACGMAPTALQRIPLNHPVNFKMELVDFSKGNISSRQAVQHSELVQVMFFLPVGTEGDATLTKVEANDGNPAQKVESMDAVANANLFGTSTNSATVATVWNVKVMLLTGVSNEALASISQEPAPGGSPLHIGGLLRFLTVRFEPLDPSDSKAKRNPVIGAIGGSWSAELDGGDPATEQSALVRTAIRTTKDQTQIDLSGCRTWLRFLDIHYHRAKHNEVTVIFVPDVWTLMPSVEEWPLVWKQQQLERKAVEARQEPANLVTQAEHALAEANGVGQTEKVEIDQAVDANHVAGVGEQPSESALEALTSAPAEGVTADKPAATAEQSSDVNSAVVVKAEPLPPPYIAVKTQQTSTCKTRAISLSLDGLLEYQIDDRDEPTFEVSLFAELFNEMLQRDAAKLILSALEAVHARGGLPKENSASTLKRLRSPLEEQPRRKKSKFDELPQGTTPQEDAKPEADNPELKSDAPASDDTPVKAADKEEPTKVEIDHELLQRDDLQHMIHALGLFLTPTYVKERVLGACDRDNRVVYRRLAERISTS
eukprot:jgi/Chlat1/8047/Chrsp73S00601